MTAPLIAIAAGGTGGHVFPAEATARRLAERDYRLALITDARGDTFGDAIAGMDVHRIRAGTFTTGGLAGRALGAAALGAGFVQALALIRRLAPDVVVGFGGYPSLAPVMAASLLGRPTLIHEQNAVLGRANRLLARRVTAIATAFPWVHGLSDASQAKVGLVGNPVRPAFTARRIAGDDYVPPAPDGRFRLVVTGGSQGARVFSRLVPAAVAALPEPKRARLDITQQCRPEDLDGARDAYAACGVQADLASFITDLPDRLAASHLAICRAGASTCAELTVLGRPALLVPYPHATDNHQRVNARALDDAGAAWLMAEASLTPEVLAGRLAVLMDSPETLAAAARHAHASALPDADQSLANLVDRLAGRDSGPDLFEEF